MNTISVTRRSLQSALAAVRREQQASPGLAETVRDIIAKVAREGDTALFAYAQRFDGVTLGTLQVTKKEIEDALAAEDPAVVRALKKAKKNIELFHKRSLRKKEPAINTEKGVQVWREFRPIEKVGLYVPGGKAAYPSTVLMLAVPASIAGCKQIVLCVPPLKDGTVPGAVLVAASIAGIDTIFKVGGAQAVAAMAYGTESVPKVSKIFGPGNQYVTAAKMQVYGMVDIDMPAGPSEVLVYADDTVNPEWVAADLLSQLEHGEDSQAILVTASKRLARAVIDAVERQRVTLPRAEIVAQSVKKSFAVVVDAETTAIEFINEYAPEHLELDVVSYRSVLPRIINAGSVFLGKYSTEPLGDYATGANHTLPTSGYAKMFSALSVDAFGKMMQVQLVTKQGLSNLRDTVETLALREGLEAHQRAVAIRYK